jgi:hypothetical protein
MQTANSAMSARRHRSNVPAAWPYPH